MTNQSTAYQESVRPVLFESELESHPYGGLGTSILVWNSGTYFWVTARHVIAKQKQSLESLRIFPTDTSRFSLPFNALCEIHSPDLAEDFTDLYILQVDLSSFISAGDAPLTAQDLATGTLCPDKLKSGDELLVVGYPEDSRSIDYDRFKIRYRREAFAAEYRGPSVEQHCHELKIQDNSRLSSYNGLSGSPVFRMVTQGPYVFPMLAGILLRGTVGSHTGFFVGADVVAHATKLSTLTDATQLCGQTDLGDKAQQGRLP